MEPPVREPTTTTDTVISATVYVTAIRWRAEDSAMTAAASATVAPSNGVVVAQCKACPPKPAVSKNNMLGTAVTGMLPRESWMLVIHFDSTTDANNWAASYSQHFDLIHCVPGT